MNEINKDVYEKETNELENLGAGNTISKRIKELGKQQVISEIGCLAERKHRIGPDTKIMKCVFDTPGLGVLETNASIVDIDGNVELEVLDAKQGLIKNGGRNGQILKDLVGNIRMHNGFRFNKSGIDPRGIEYKDATGQKWQVPIIKENDEYNAKLLFRPEEGKDFWCRISGGIGGSYTGIGQKIKCDTRPHREDTSIIDKL